MHIFQIDLKTMRFRCFFSSVFEKMQAVIHSTKVRIYAKKNQGVCTPKIIEYYTKLTKIICFYKWLIFSVIFENSVIWRKSNAFFFKIDKKNIIKRANFSPSIIHQCIYFFGSIYFIRYLLELCGSNILYTSVDFLPRWGVMII